MEDFAEYLASEAVSENAAVHEFVTSYQFDNEVHVFMEGEEDIAFYLPEIRRFAGDRRIFSYVCGGKWNVVGARDSIEHFYDVCTLFFVDRDYDDLLSRQAPSSPSLYITEGYSIENWAASEKAIEVLLEDVLAVPPREAAQIKSRAIEIQSPAASRMYFLAAWILAAKEAGCNPNLNNTNSIGPLLSLSAAGLMLFDRKSFSAFKRKVDSGRGLPPIGLQVKWYRAIRGLDFDKICRGKYHAWIFCKAVHLAIEEENDRRSRNKKKKIRKPGALQGAHVVELMAGRIPCASSLTQFLERNLAGRKGG
ncbi:DUF4435 domain-containing protein [Cereibacter sphaeroides]|uniref:DUF4435 domain-containing protein n=1 Tax=Cereibacter sphaeroides TaxID=1063 RepID=UPI0011AE552B|nr:DUF4435 domain-containing protein [Cereibacter sphaeroides]